MTILTEVQLRILEEKKRLGITSKMMSERSLLHISEETISRYLTGKTQDPGVNTVLDIGGTVGLAPYELFMDATLAAEFRAFLDLKSKSKETEAERIRIVADNESLKITNAALSDKVSSLEMQLNHKEEIIALQVKHNENIMALLNHYNNLNSNK